MDHEKVLAQIYLHLEANDVEKAVTGCLRLSRSTKDYLNTAVLLRELFLNDLEFLRALERDTSDLNEEARKYLYQISKKRWLEIHTLDFSVLPDKPDYNVQRVAVTQLDAEIEQLQRAIANHVVPANMHPYDTAAFTDRYNQANEVYALGIKGMQTVKARLKAFCLEYATHMEHQLDLQRKNQGFLDLVQNDVNNFFKAQCSDVYVKLQKAAELAGRPDLENAALLLTEVRRALKAAADFFCPPITEKVTCADGKERDLGEEKYLNRLQEFLAKRLKNSTSKQLLKAELEALGKFLDRLNDLASKGVHASVALAEAKQGLVGLYFFLFNLSQSLSQKVDS